MGGITTPVLATLGTVNSVGRTVERTGDLLGIGKSGRRRRERTQLQAEQAAETADLTARQAAEAEALARRNALAAGRIRIEAGADGRRRSRTLRQETGRTRAALGAQGIGTADGSGEAIILGRERAAAAEDKDADRLDALRLAALAEEEEVQSRRNLLDLTRQQERQRLERLARGF